MNITDVYNVTMDTRFSDYKVGDGMRFTFAMLPGEDLVFSMPGEGLEWAIDLVPEKSQEEEMPEIDFDFVTEGGRVICVC